MLKHGRFSLLGLSLISLVACSSMHPGGAAHSAHAPPTTVDSSAQAYAMGVRQGVNGQVRKDKSGKIINPLVAPANQTYYFDFDSIQLNSANNKAINIQANYIATHPHAKVRLEGNTDNRGSREYNIGLGWRRDQAVAQLLKQDGVAPRQIDMVSYGKERPAVIGDNEQAWELNRRVHLVYEAY